MGFIPVNVPVFGEAELKYATEAVSTGWVSGGKFLPRFEEEFAAYCGRKHGVAVSNGSTALQASIAALDLSPGDEVIMPTFTIVSCALAIAYQGATPVLVDVDPETWCMDVDQVAAKITPRTKAIMPVHIYGHPVDMDPVFALAEQHGLAIIEDAAEVLGAEYQRGHGTDGARWVKCGALGDMSTFSFYGNKQITTGEGGMVVTDDDALADKLRSIRNLCFHPGRRFHHEAEGFNFRMTNLQAAIGVGQLERIDEIVAAKHWLGRGYTQRLEGLRDKLQLPVEKPWAKQVYWMYSVVLDDRVPFDAEELAKRLRAEGVDTRPFFLGMHVQPIFHKRGWFEGESYPVCDRIAARGLYLPSGLALTEDQMDQVTAAVTKALA